MENRKIIMYATTKDGEGKVVRLCEYDDIDEITIHTNMFTDVEITFEYEYKRDENSH